MRIRGWYGESYVPPTTPSVPKRQEPDDAPAKPDRPVEPPDFRDEPPGKKQGLALGRFMPPHRGHQLLVDWGRTFCAHMTVVLVSRTGDPIPGALREHWLRELFPDVKLIHLRDAVPTIAPEHPRFFAEWAEVVRRHLPEPPKYLIASDPQAGELARHLNMIPILVDPRRESLPISARRIRAHPMRHWEMLPEPVRPYFLKRVCLVGPAGSGKSTLARALAARFNTVSVGEYARTVMQGRSDARASDIPHMARGQLAAEAALARHANRVMVCDTDLLTVQLWSERLFGACPDWIAEQAAQASYDLTLVLEGGEDPRREQFLTRLTTALTASNRSYERLSGDHEARAARAEALIETLLADSTGAGRGHHLSARCEISGEAAQ